jgi:CheY-like chemotaxis protein
MATILSAEDDLDIASFIVRILERAEHRVISVNDGRSALASALVQVPDLAILDVEMPGMNGLEVCRAMRDDPRTAHIPVIIASGSISPPFSDVHAAGGTASLPKPFTPTQLRECVAQHLNETAGRMQ